LKNVVVGKVELVRLSAPAISSRRANYAVESIWEERGESILEKFKARTYRADPINGSRQK